MRRAVRGSRRPPRAPRKSAAPLLAPTRTGRPGLLPARYRPHRGHPDRDDALLAALAEHPDRAPIEVEAAGVELAQLADPDGRRVEQLENRDVAQRQRRGGRLTGGELALRPVLAVGQDPAHLVPAQHLRQRPPGLGGAELRPGIDREPPLTAREGGEGPGRRAPPGQRRPGGARLMLVRQPASQRGQVKRSGVADTGPARVLQERLDVADIGAHGVTRERALGRQVTAERRQRRAQRGRQALGRTVRVGSGAASHHHGHSVHRSEAVRKRPGQCLSSFCPGRHRERLIPRIRGLADSRR